MNATTEMNTENESDVDWTDQAIFVLDNYVIRIAGSLGVLLNLFFAIVLRHKSLKNKLYDFFWCRVAINFLISVLVAGQLGNCFACEFSSYEVVIYQYHINALGLRLLKLSSLLSDLHLIVNRFLEITRKKNCVQKMSKKLVLFVCLFPPAVLTVPAHLAVRIVAGSTNQTYIKELTQFGSSKTLLVYSVLVFLFESVIPCVVMIFLNCVSNYKFRDLMYRHAHLTKNKTESKKAEIRFTKMIFILTSICILSTFLDLVTTLLARLIPQDTSLFSPTFVKALAFAKSVTNLLVYSVHALDGIIYLKLDKNLWQLILKIFSLRKVNKLLTKCYLNIIKFIIFKIF